MKKTIGLIAHVDAGKTTLAEAILYKAKATNKKGRVDNGDTIMDSHPIEKKRGITVFSEQAHFYLKDQKYFLVDTPGHIDFSPEMEASLSILDLAVIIISGVEGIEGHTETIWQLLQKYNIPTLFFINKVDRDGVDIDKITKDIQTRFTKEALYIQEDLTRELNQETIEAIADIDYELLDMYLEDRYDKDTWINHMGILMKESLLYPILAGSALKDIGIDKLISSFELLCRSDYDDSGEFKGQVYKIRYIDNERLTYIKLEEGSIKIKDKISYNSKGKEFIEGINSIRYYNGQNFEEVKEASAGDIIAISGLSESYLGMGIGGHKEQNYELIAPLKSRVIIDKEVDRVEVIRAFDVLTNENPYLNARWKQDLQELNIDIMGSVQLEVLKDIIKTRFNLIVDFEKPSIIYKETIEDIVVGRGHFEPLKHYAEVHLRLEPLPRGSGIVFDNLCSTDDLSRGYQNLVKQHMLEKQHRGILTGSPITDIKITLLKGRSHNKHTSGGDFREASYRALRQGLEKSNTILLEPYYEFRITTSRDYLGRIMADIQSLNGIIEAPDIDGDIIKIQGRGPVNNFIDYQKRLISITKGSSSIKLYFSTYDICRDKVEVAKTLAYNKDFDTEYPSSSIFCSKGQGYTIPWYEADKHMHCK